MAANSYKDPLNLALVDAMESKYGLPEGLLRNIVVKGERSNADQVSEAGARTIFQITPQTRQAAIKQYGIDPYLSTENAAEVAARLLKDSLNRNGGGVSAAVGEYHGGTDRSNWGPRTRAYVARVTGGSVSDRLANIKADREAAQGPSIAKVYQAYKSGQMTPQERAEFEQDVTSGAVMLPRGAKIDVKPNVPTLPAGVVKAYTTHSEMSDAERDQLDQDLKDGIVQLPQGTTLTRPAPRTAAESIGMGVRNVMTGAAGLADLPIDLAKGGANLVYGATIGPATKALGGTPEAPLPYGQTRKGAEMLADAMGLASPETESEKLNAALIEGGTQGLLTAGGGAALSGAPGAAGMVGRALAASPAVDVAASAAATGTSEAARQQGAGPWTQLGLGLVAGLVTGHAVSLTPAAAEGLAARFGPKAVKTVADTPPEVVFDPKGNLTDEGREIAARAGMSGDDLKKAYAETQTPPEAGAAPRQEPQGAPPREPVAQEVAQGPEGPQARPVDGQPFSQEAPNVYRDYPEAPGELPPESNAGPAAARVAEAKSVGVDLTKGQATQDFATQDAEQTLRAQASGEGEKARAFYTRQQEQIADAVDRFKSAFGDLAATAAERGAQVKQALSDMRDAGKAGVSALYRQARDMAESLGERGQNLIQLDTGPLLARMREIFIDEGVDEGVRKALRQQAAKYGLIGDTPRTVEGETTVTLRDTEGNPASKITFTGPPQRLTIVNAEDLRKTINGLYAKDTTGAAQSLKGLIDDAVEEAVSRAAQDGPGEVGGAFRAARAAHQVQKETFGAKDIIQKLIAFKKGTQTPEVLPEGAIKAIFAGGKDALTNLKKVKAVLLSKPTEASRAAWQAIKAHGVADIFDQALSPRGEVSGARLNTAIKRFGVDKLKVLLDEQEFNELMKLRRVIGDATIPIPNTTNPSGSAYKIVNMLANAGVKLSGVARLVPGVGPIADTAVALLKQGRETATARRTLEGVENFTPEAAANADTPTPKVGALDYVRRFIRTAHSDQIIAPILASAANEERP